MSEPKGVVALVLSPDGVVIGTGTSFEKDKPGGFDLTEAQRMRARDRAWRHTLDQLSSKRLFECFDSYLVDRIRDSMRKKGWKEQYVVTGEPKL